MSTNTTVRPDPNPYRKWILPALLALLIIGVLVVAFLATHNVFGGSSKATATPTPHVVVVVKVTATPTLKVVTTTPKPKPATPAPTATQRPGPTGTPRPGPTGTPRPGPTATPKPTPAVTATPTPTRAGSAAGVRTGGISYPLSQIQGMQHGANAGDPKYTYRRDMYAVVRKDLPTYYGFTNGPVTIVSPPPPPNPTPTAETNPEGLPEDAIDVEYQGHKYAIVLEQPAQKGSQGIWVIITITQLS